MFSSSNQERKKSTSERTHEQMYSLLSLSIPMPIAGKTPCMMVNDATKVDEIVEVVELSIIKSNHTK